jgi:MoxR-like ATPase
LWGSAGTGKTELLRHMAWLMGLPFVRINLTEFSEVDDIIGKQGLQANEDGTMETVFIEGRLTKAWGMRCVICNDEPNVAPDGIWQVYRALNDNSKILALDLDKGQIKERNTFCFNALAMNPAWDPLNVGVKELGAADGDRIVHIEISLPPAEVEREIILQRCRGTLDWEPDKATMDALMKVAEVIRGMTKDGQLPISWGIRPNIKVARQLKFFDPLTAYRLAVANNLEPKERESLLAAVSSNFKLEE